jgi:hypothetical protein
MGFASEANIHTLFSLKSTTEAGLVALKRENEQLRVAANELGHRLKNLVAVTQSIARQTIRQSSTMEDFEARFSGRLGAFGRSAARSIGLALHELATNSGLRCSGAPSPKSAPRRVSRRSPAPSARARRDPRCATCWPPNMVRSRCQRATLRCIGSLPVEVGADDCS